MLKGHKNNVFVLDLVAILGILLVAPTAKAGLIAWDPIPGDGAIDYDGGSLEWTAGDTAVSHKVYLSTDSTIEESDLVTETDLTLVLVDLTPGTTYYWRVDEVEADKDIIEGSVWNFSTLPFEAHFPSPADGAPYVAVDVELGWTAGKNTFMHKLYFGTDEKAIAARDMTTCKGMLMTSSYDPGPLDLFTTYYWAVDEFTPAGTVNGPVWSFTTALDVSIDIKPGSDPNPINLGSNGLVPVAIFSSPEFDTTQVNPTSVSLAGAGVAVRGKGKSMAHVEDVDGDGLLDLVVQVETQSFADLGECGTVELTGTTFDGENIVGYDEIIIVSPE